MEKGHFNGDPAKLKKGKGNMMRDAKGRFCKANAKVDWDSEKDCRKHKCTKHCSNPYAEEYDDNIEKKLQVAQLLDEVQEIMATVPDTMNDPEESLVAIDGVLAAFTKLREACVHLIELDKAPKKKYKKSCKKSSSKIPKEILDLARELNIPIEDIIACGTVDLDTGEGTCYHRKR